MKRCGRIIYIKIQWTVQNVLVNMKQVKPCKFLMLTVMYLNNQSIMKIPTLYCELYFVPELSATCSSHSLEFTWSSPFCLFRLDLILLRSTHNKATSLWQTTHAILGHSFSYLTPPYITISFKCNTFKF